MNPQTGEILALVSLPTYDDNLFARGISSADYQALVNDPDRPLLNHATQENFPPGSTYKLVTGHRRSGRQEDHGHHAARDQGVPDPGHDQVLRLEPPWVRRLRHLLRVRAFERHVLLPGGRHARHRSARATGPGSTGSARRPGSTCPGEVSGIVPTNQWKQDTLGAPIFPGETYQAGHRPGLRRRHADPVDQRVRGDGQRRDAVPAPDRPRHRGA